MKMANNKAVATFQAHMKTLLATTILVITTTIGHSAPVPGYVPPVVWDSTPEYADDTRGIYVPAHEQYRIQRPEELAGWGKNTQLASSGNADDAYERKLNTMANGYPSSMGNELSRIAQDPGILRGGQGTTDAHLYAPQQQIAQGYGQGQGQGYSYNNGQQQYPQQGYDPQQAYGEYPIAMQQPPRPATPPYSVQTAPTVIPTGDGGVEIASGDIISGNPLDMHNSLVRLREERVSVRRALQRMMDQIGGGDWSVVWDLDENNASLPEMEISIYAEEPFMNVMNALLARVQTRSGQPLRVIRYDQTKRLVITDRAGGYRLAGATNGIGVDNPDDVVVSERVLKEAMISLHYDEIPLADALENITAQAGKGQWRLRMYAGRDQVLKPAHIEEPFNVAMERLLKLFNLKYEVFPGGKLVVITGSGKFGFNGMTQR